MNRKKIFALTLVSVMAIFFVLTLPTYAQGILEIGDETKKGLGNTGPISFVNCLRSGNCGAEHIFTLASNIIRYLVGVSGALALLMYVMGGIWMLFSGGNQSRVERGKDIIIGTSVALFSILGGWLIISFILEAVKVDPAYQPQQLACGNVQCLVGQTCLNGTCEDLCKIEKGASDPSHNWDCTDPQGCGLSLSTCQANSNRCELNKCGDSTKVCCYGP